MLIQEVTEFHFDGLMKSSELIPPPTSPNEAVVIDCLDPQMLECRLLRWRYQVYLLHIILAIFIAILVLRMVYRYWINFPPYPGNSPLQGENVEGLLEESAFWNLIMESRRASNGQYDDQVLALTDLLERQSLNDIVAFEKAFISLMSQANNFRYWEAAYALNWGCSDDCFVDFCAWWIGQGKNKFYWSLRIPRLLFLFVVKEQFQQYEGLQYCASDAYKNLNGRDMPASDIELKETRGKLFNEGLALLKYPELALLAW